MKQVYTLIIATLIATVALHSQKIRPVRKK